MATRIPPTDEFTEGYSSGYGQAKADCIARVTEILTECEEALNGSEVVESFPPLQDKITVLHWVRTTLKHTITQ